MKAILQIVESRQDELYENNGIARKVMKPSEYYVT